MAITMLKLCEDAKSKYDMELVAGKNGIENTVRWVHMVEDREVPDFLHGGELIFTTGIGHIESDDRMLEFTRNLYAHGAAGVVFNIGPYIKRIPPDVISFANENDFPVFTLPWKVHIIDISYDFCGRIIENEKAEMSLMQAFKNLIFAPEKEEEYLPAMQKNGFNAAERYRVFAITFYGADGKEITSPLYSKNKMLLWCIFARSDSPAAMFIYTSRLIVVKQRCPEHCVERILAALEKAFRQSKTSYKIGISDDGAGYLSVPYLYKHSNAALVTAKYEGSAATRYDDIGVNRLILAVEDKAVLETYANEILSAIIRYDEENNTDCTELLKLYIECDCSVNAVAEKSGVHRNTVNNRIKQIRDLLGSTLTEKKKAELVLAFKIKDLIKFI